MFSPGVSRFVFDVSGMSCRNCERILTERLTSRPAVDAVHADHTTGVLVVVAVGVDRAALEQTIAGAGYAVTG